MHLIHVGLFGSVPYSNVFVITQCSKGSDMLVTCMIFVLVLVGNKHISEQKTLKSALNGTIVTFFFPNFPLCPSCPPVHTDFTAPRCFEQDIRLYF